MTGPILRPIEGNPDSVRILASALTSGAAKLSAINHVLVNLKAGASWDSPSGELFEQSVQESPPLLDALIDRYAGAAAALRTFAGELGEAQASAQRAIERKKAQSFVYAALEDQMAARMDAGQPWNDVLQSQNEVLADMNAADASHAVALERFEAADRLLARRLRVLAEDILDDSWHYTALTKVQGFSQGLASLPGWSRKAPVLGQVLMVSDAVSTLSQVALRVFYDEGSWKEIGINTTASVTMLGASSLKNGALAASRPMSRLVDGRRAHLGESLSTKERISLGTLDALKEQYPRASKFIDPDVALSRMIVPLDDVPALASTAGLSVKQKVQAWRVHGRALATRKADEVFFDNWRAVSAGGANAQRMFIAGSTLERAVPKVQEGAVNTFVEKPEEKASAPTYP